jgi:hypothetical protein
MSLLRESFDPDRSENGDSLEPFVEHRAIRPVTRRLGSGALACPSCRLPLLPAGRLSISDALACPFCGLEDRARRFVALGAHDTAANAVHVVARMPV